MTPLDRCLGWLMQVEGGFANVVSDRGGPTMSGWTQKSYDAWRDYKGLPPRPVDEITVIEWRQGYEDVYWLGVRAPELPARLAIALTDAAVHHGPAQAIKFLQRAVLTVADGLLGPKTLAATREVIQRYGEWALLERLQDIENRLLALELQPRPLVWLIGKPFEHIEQVDTHAPSGMKH